MAIKSFYTTVVLTRACINKQTAVTNCVIQGSVYLRVVISLWQVCGF